MPAALELTEFERFKWNVLGDAVFEDYQGLWEPLWWLRGGGEIAGQSEEDRQRFAERALRELHDKGLVYFFRVPDPPYDPDAAATDDALRLTPPEVDQALRGDWWRSPDGLGGDHTRIWYGPTPAGEAWCENPPPPVHRLWRLDRWPDALVPPIVIDNRPDGISIYKTAGSLSGQLEPWYVTDEDFDAYDAEGRLVWLRIETREVPTFFGWRRAHRNYVVAYAAEAEPEHADALRRALLQGLGRVGQAHAEHQTLPLPDLLRIASAKLDSI